MVVIELEDNIRIGSYGVAHLNGHHVAFGAMPDKYQAKCLACEKEFTRSNDYFQLSGLDAQMFQLYSFHKFMGKPCQSDADSVEDIISKRVMSKYIGQPATADAKISMENEIEELLGYGMSASVDINSDPTTTVKCDKDIL